MERSQQQQQQQQAVVVALVVLALVATLSVGGAGAAAVHTKRNVHESASGNMVKLCLSTTPCGWAVYVPFTRRVDYFMPNTCQCPKGKSCLRTDDDLSVSAYVYRCKETPSTESTSAA